MAESHVEARSRIKIFYRTAPHFNDLSRLTPQVGIAALRRPRRRAQRQATENESHSECLISIRSALPGGGIAARCPLPAWMAESHFETRSRIKIFHGAALQ
jgi:hypothetical protein